MDHVLYRVRKYTGIDAEACAECFYESFFDGLLTESDRQFLRDYAQVLIEKCSFAYVAESGGRVVGFIAGHFKKQFDRKLAKKREAQAHYGAWLRCFFKFAVGGYKLSAPFQEQFSRFFAQVKEGDKSAPRGCDCELMALCSLKQYRKGLGTALWRAFAAHCRACGARCVRVFTNSDATYTFYEKRGFVRVWEKPYSFGGGSSYIYEYNLSGGGKRDA